MSDQNTDKELDDFMEAIASLRKPKSDLPPPTPPNLTTQQALDFVKAGLHKKYSELPHGNALACYDNYYRNEVGGLKAGIELAIKYIEEVEKKL